MTSQKNTQIRRNRYWYGGHNKDGFIHRSWMKSQGFPDHLFDGRPVIGICNTWSEFSPCNAGLRDLAESVKRGVWENGGFPIEFPVTSLGETQMKPTAMLFRNLLAMDVEEHIRAHGMDAVVLLAGCDKTTPGLLMGALSVDLPILVVSAGPMLSGKWRGKNIGSGTDVWRFSESVRAGSMSMQEFMHAEGAMSRSHGVCMSMGTASTMACIVEAMGLALPHNATFPAVDARRKKLAHLSGLRIVDMVKEDIRPSTFLTRHSFENAIVVNAAIGGSTNAIVHLLAMAGRAGIKLSLEDFAIGMDVPLLVNCMPSGKYLMEDFCYAGGLPVVLAELTPFLRRANTVMGGDIRDYAEGAQCFNRDVIFALAHPCIPHAGIIPLFGSLATKGAIIKPSAATPRLLEHQGKAVVFENIEHMHKSIDDYDFVVHQDDILVLKGCGPRGYPGMPEVGNMPIPRVLAQQGIRDMVRISDARMSGTAFGTVVLHTSPEAAIGGNLAFVQNGDRIALSASSRKIDLLVDSQTLAERANMYTSLPEYSRGYTKLYIDHVLGADEGADFDFLVGKDTRMPLRESH